VSASELQKAVSELEAGRTFPNRKALWSALAQTPWARERGLTPGGLKRRASRLGIQVRTPKARHRFRRPLPLQRGKEDSLQATSGSPGTSCGEIARGASEGQGKKRIPLPVLRADAPPRYHHLVDRAEAGSLRAAVTLKCLDCSNWQTDEVRHCTVTDCPLYPVRPYQP
jgi:hypothetical protein